jgi:predicted solute-binding protein
MLIKLVNLEVTHETVTRLLAYRKAFETADATLNQVLDLADLAKAAQSTPFGMLGVTAIPRPTPMKSKPASSETLQQAIITALTTLGDEATKAVVTAEVAKLLPEAAKHEFFDANVSYAASVLRKAKRLANGHDHGHWGLWRLVP